MALTVDQVPTELIDNYLDRKCGFFVGAGLSRAAGYPDWKGLLLGLIKKAEADHSLIYGGGQQRNLRSGTLPVALCVGMAAAAALQGTEEAGQERERIRTQMMRFVDALNTSQWLVAVNGPAAELRHPGNANVRFEGFAAHDILGALQPYLAASTGSACTSGIPEPSHVLKAIGLTDSNAQSSIRFSFGRGTTNEDVDEAIKLVHAVLSRLTRARIQETI